MERIEMILKYTTTSGNFTNSCMRKYGISGNTVDKIMNDKIKTNYLSWKTVKKLVTMYEAEKEQ